MSQERPKKEQCGDQTLICMTVPLITKANTKKAWTASSKEYTSKKLKKENKEQKRYGNCPIVVVITKKHSAK